MELKRTWVSGACVMALAVAMVLIPAPASCGDDDKESAYKIYIDPETGKYTTEDPHAALPPPRVSAINDLSVKRNSGWRLAAVATLITVLTVASIALNRRGKAESRS